MGTQKDGLCSSQCDGKPHHKFPEKKIFYLGAGGGATEDESASGVLGKGEKTRTSNPFSKCHLPQKFLQFLAWKGKLLKGIH